MITKDATSHDQSWKRRYKLLLLSFWIVCLKLIFNGVILHLAQILSFAPSVCSSTELPKARWEQTLWKIVTPFLQLQSSFLLASSTNLVARVFSLAWGTQAMQKALKNVPKRSCCVIGVKLACP